MEQTNNSRLAALQSQRNSIRNAMGAMVEALRATLHDEFVAKGGCGKCYGRGVWVSWDTSDSMSGCYAEFSPCDNPDCTPETRALTGKDSFYDRYDRVRGQQDPVTVDPRYTEHLAALQPGLRQVEREIDLLEPLCIPRKGTLVVVTKGRKVPKGTTGVVAFVHSNGGLLVKDEAHWQDRSARGTWVNADNCEVLRVL